MHKEGGVGVGVRVKGRGMAHQCQAVNDSPAPTTSLPGLFRAKTTLTPLPPPPPPPPGIDAVPPSPGGPRARDVRRLTRRPFASAFAAASVTRCCRASRARAWIVTARRRRAPTPKIKRPCRKWSLLLCEQFPNKWIQCTE